MEKSHNRDTYIGLDIGGTKFLVASADRQGKIIRRLQTDTPDGLQDGIDLLNDMVRQVSAGAAITGMGAAIGGPLDWQSGVVSPLHQPSWRSVPLKSTHAGRMGLPFLG